MKIKLFSTKYLLLFATILGVVFTFTGCSSKKENLPATIYTVIFKGRDGVPLEIKKIERGKSISSKPETPRELGFAFKGWYAVTNLTGAPYNFDSAVTRSFTIYAKFVKLFTVDFKTLNGGIAENPQEVESGNKAILPTTIPRKAEHIFKNWYTTTDFSGTPYDFDTPVSKDLTLYAKFVEFFTITFKIFGDSATENSRKIESGSKVIRPTTDPTKMGYDFVNWYISNDPKKQITAFDFDNTPITENTILYAKWLIKTYSIAFHAGSDSNKVNDKTADHNTTITAPKSPTKAGHTFNGWYTTNDPQAQMREFDFKNTPITENTTLYAKWQINTCTITFYTEPNASRVNDKTTNYKTIITAPKNPTKAEHIFKNWYTTTGFSGIPYDFGTAVTRNFTLYAKFIELFTVTFKTPDGSTTEDSQRVESGGKAILPTTDPTKSNFVFKGWYITKETNGVSYDFDTPVSKNLTLYAKFPKSFMVTFDTGSDGSTVSPQNIALDEPAIPPTNNPTKDNSVFKGWHIMKDASGIPYDFDAPITKKLTLYAKWKATNEDTPMAKACSNGIMPDLNTADFESIKSMLEPLEVTVGTTLTCLHFSNTGADNATGKDWNHAFSTKQLKTKLDGITDADSKKVYLMLLSKGIYKSTTGTDRAISFGMRNYTAIIGGWNNNYDYDVKTNISLLSGDIGIENEKSDNSYHIIFNKGNNLTTTAILYGVTLSYSNADGKGKTHTRIGGAIYNHSSNPTISQSIFSKNYAHEGGAIYNYFSNPTISQSFFNANTARIGGGAISNSSSSDPKIIQSTFSDNTAFSGGAISNSSSSNPKIIQSSFSNNKGSYGGAIYNGYSSSPKIIQSSFSNNTVDQNGGAIYSYLSNPKIIQSSFSNNTANQGGAIYQDNDILLANVVLWGNRLTGRNNSGSQIYLSAFDSGNQNITLGSVVLEGGTDSIGFDSSANRKKISKKNIITINPNLDALSDNGGAVQTLAISSGSCAVNKGLYIKIKNDYSIFYYSDDKNSWYSNPNLETAVTLPTTDTFDLATDGRGYTFSGKPDIGAYEYGGTQ